MNNINNQELIQPITILDEKKYLLLYYASIDDGEEIKSYEILTGRKQAYDFIKGMIESLDIHRSKLLVEGTMLDIDNSPSVYQIMKYFEGIFDDGFDIEDYNVGDVD